MWGFCVIVLTLWVFLQVAVGSLIFFPSLFCTFPKTSWEDKTDSFILCNNKNQLTLWLAVAFLAYGWRSWIDGPQKKSLTLLLWWFGTLICWHQMKQTQWGKKEDKSDRGSDWGEKKAVHESGWKCVCVCVCVSAVCEARRSALKTWAETANLRSVKMSGCICVWAETRRGLRVCEGFSLAS